MFDNINTKLKDLAKIIFILGIITAVLLVLISIVGNMPRLIIPSVALVFGGWVSSLIIYGFGELLEYVFSISKNVKELSNKTKEKSDDIFLNNQ